MWVSPNHPNPPRAAEPPPDDGRLIASFPRGAEAELRVVLAEYNGHPYVSLRVFERDRSGRWWPVKAKGVSVRLAEVAGMIGALCAVERTLEADGLGDLLAGRETPRGAGRGDAGRFHLEQRKIVGPGPGAGAGSGGGSPEPFDEFQAPCQRLPNDQR